MSPFFTFVTGLLIGWLVEWVIDWIYWRRRYRILQEYTARCEQERAAFEIELSNLRKTPPTVREKINQPEPFPNRLEAQPVETVEEFDEGGLQPGNVSNSSPDNLEVINGIGPVIARMLNQSRITTFEQLAEQTPESLRRILGDVIKRLADEESLIEQARLLALRKQDEEV